MPIATEPLRIGGIVVALTGRWVNQRAVDRYGWHDKVAPDPTPTPAEHIIDVALPGDPAPKGRRRKGT